MRRLAAWPWWTVALAAILLAGAAFSYRDAGRYYDDNRNYRWACESAHGQYSLGPGGRPQCLAPG